MRTITALALVLALGSCADYTFTVNERVVYTPAPLFSDYEISDAALAECVEQHIADLAATAADSLEVLNCSHAGVADLAGIQVFAQLRQLKLSNNSINELQPLADMAALQELYLDGNALESIVPIRDLPELEFLDLGENPELRCEELDALREHTGLALRPPAHCSG
jgi:Leucine-rich repeat (LRR) protein